MAAWRSWLILKTSQSFVAVRSEKSRAKHASVDPIGRRGSRGPREQRRFCKAFVWRIGSDGYVSSHFSSNFIGAAILFSRDRSLCSTAACWVLRDGTQRAGAGLKGLLSLDVIFSAVALRTERTFWSCGRRRDGSAACASKSYFN